MQQQDDSRGDDSEDGSDCDLDTERKRKVTARRLQDTGNAERRMIHKYIRKLMKHARPLVHEDLTRPPPSSAASCDNPDSFESGRHDRCPTYVSHAVHRAVLICCV